MKLVPGLLFPPPRLLLLLRTRPTAVAKWASQSTEDPLHGKYLVYPSRDPSVGVYPLSLFSPYFAGQS